MRTATHFSATRTRQVGFRLRTIVSLILMALVLQSFTAAMASASELDMESTDDFGDSPFGAPEPQCPIGVCFNAQGPFSDSAAPLGWADPFKGDPTRDWGSTGWSVNLCCSNAAQKLEILSSADNGAPGATDCRDTPVADVSRLGCKAGGDVSMGRAFNVLSVGQVYSAVAFVKLIDVHEPQPGMFRARLTIHGYDNLGRLQQECNAFLQSTQVDGVPGTEDQTAIFVPIEIPACEMVDTGPSNGVGNTITKVDVAVRANDFKNDIAYGAIRVNQIIFVRES